MEYEIAIFYNTIREEIYLYTPLETLKDVNKPINNNNIYRLKVKEFPKVAKALYRIYSNNLSKKPLNKPIGEYAEYSQFTSVPKDIYESITGLKMPEEVKQTASEKTNHNNLERILEVA